MKYKYENTCPCGDVDFKITYEAEEPYDIFCPFCGAQMEDIDIDEQDEED